MMVDSMPTAQAPPSSTNKSAPNSLATCAAVVGLMRPNLFALGAARPQMGGWRCRQACSKAWATGCAGQRRPMVACPPVAAWAMPGRQGQDEGQRPGPEGLDQLLGKHRDGLGVVGHGGAGALGVPLGIGHMHDQRVVGRAALGRKMWGHGAGVVRIGGQAVHGFGWQTDQLALGQRVGRAGNGVGVVAVPKPCLKRLDAHNGSRLQRGGAGRLGRGGRDVEVAPSCGRVGPGPCRTGAGGQPGSAST